MNIRNRIEALEKTKMPDEVVTALKAEILRRDPGANVSACEDIASTLKTLASYLPN